LNKKGGSTKSRAPNFGNCLQYLLVVLLGMSSLAAQLAQSASLNVALLTDRSKRKPSESYLFTGREADQYDLDSIYALGTNAFLKLCSIDHRLKQFEHELFSDTARATDRTLLTKKENEKLNKSIGQFLGLLGPWMLDVPTARVMEWLVRRFRLVRIFLMRTTWLDWYRIHEFNVEDLLALFLPYHDTPQFAKLVTILHIKYGGINKLSFFHAHIASDPVLPGASSYLSNLRLKMFHGFLL